MIVTEEVARTKDCPTQGRDKCTASECMLWKFGDRIVRYENGGIEAKSIPVYETTNKGYCKLGRD